MTESTLLRVAMQHEQLLADLRAENVGLIEQAYQLRTANRHLREITRPTKHQIRDLKRNAREANDKLTELRSYIGAADDIELASWVRGAKSVLEMLKGDLDLGDDTTFAELYDKINDSIVGTPDPQEPKTFQVGDYVRVGNEYRGADNLRDRVGVVVDVDGTTWPYGVRGYLSAGYPTRVDQGRFHYDELVPWTPQVGDRVRIKAGEEFMLDYHIGQVGVISAPASVEDSRYEWEVKIDNSTEDVLYNTDELEPYIA